MVRALQGTPNSIGLVHNFFADGQPGLIQAGLQNLQGAVRNSSAHFVTANASTAAAAMSEALKVFVFHITGGTWVLSSIPTAWDWHTISRWHYR